MATGTYTIPEEVTQAWRDLRFKRKYRWVIIAVNEEDQSFYLDHAESEKTKTVNHLAKQLPDAEPRYVIFDFEYETADKRKAERLYFIMWSPSTGSTTAQVTYLHARPILRAMCEGGIYDLNCVDGKELVTDVVKVSNFSNDDEEAEVDDDWMDQ